MHNIPREIRSMNHRLGEQLGRNPHGEPLYKWIWVNDWEHFMRDITGYQPTAHPNGLIVMEPVYKRRRMVPALDGSNAHLKDRWHVGHWHDCGDQDTWERQYGSSALWSRKGHYTQTDVWGPQGQLPTETLTDALIIRVKQFREATYADIRAHFENIEAKQEQDRDNQMMDMIGDAMTAFYQVPGSKGSVSFPTPPSMIVQPSA